MFFFYIYNNVSNNLTIPLYQINLCSFFSAQLHLIPLNVFYIYRREERKTTTKLVFNMNVKGLTEFRNEHDNI